MNIQTVMQKAVQLKTVLPAFNIPFLPMLQPIARAIADTDSVAIIQVARLEWEKFGSESLERVAEEYAKYQVPDHTFLHLDHVPVLDEDHKDVEYLPMIRRAIAAGYQSVMIDGSRLPLAGNIHATYEVACMAHAAGIPVEAELGAVMGHEEQETVIPYEQIFALRQGFTETKDAVEFAQKSDCDWLSVAVGNIHGAIAENLRNQKKPAAQLDIGRISEIEQATRIPLVLHGGSGIPSQYILRAVSAGIAKINVGTEMRQAYQQAMREKNDTAFARDVVYERCKAMICGHFKIERNAELFEG